MVDMHVAVSHLRDLWETATSVNEDTEAYSTSMAVVSDYLYDTCVDMAFHTSLRSKPGLVPTILARWISCRRTPCLLEGTPAALTVH